MVENVKRPLHVGISVKKMERSLEWYEKTQDLSALKMITFHH